MPSSDLSSAPSLTLWQRLRQSRIVRWGMDLALIALVIWGVSRFTSRHLLSEAELAPDFVHQTLDGKRIQLSDYKGKTVLVQFFAPWCGVCRLEMDNWQRVQDLRGDKLQVLAVGLAWEDEADIREFLGDTPPSYPVLLGSDKTQALYKVESFPTHYVIDEHGNIESRGQGYTTTIGYWLRSL